MLRSLSSLCFVLFLCGCSSDQSSTSDTSQETSILSISPKGATDYAVADLFVRSDYLVLSGYPGLPGAIDQLKVFNDLMVASTKSSPACLLTYSRRTGELITSICEQGDAPGQYQSIQDFQYIEESNQFVLLDRSRKRIMYFDGDGQYLWEEEHPGSFSANAFAIFATGDFLFYAANGHEETGNRLIQWNPEDGTITGQYLPVIPEQQQFLNIQESNNFYQVDGQWRFAKAFDPHMYQIAADQPTTPAFRLAYGEHDLPEEMLYRSYDNVYEFFTALRKTDYAFNRLNYVEHTDHLAFFLEWRETFLLALYDKKSGNYRMVSGLTDFPGCPSLEPDPFLDYGPLAVTPDGYLVFYLEDLTADPTLATCLATITDAETAPEAVDFVLFLGQP